MSAAFARFRNLLLLLICSSLILSGLPAWSASDLLGRPVTPVSSPSSSAPSSLPLCKPGVCFTSEAAKAEYARENHCTFDAPKVECEDTEVKPEGVVAVAKALGRFVDGLIDGLKQQLVDLWDFFKELFTNPSETWEALKTLAKMIIEDPKGAAELFIAMLGDDAAKLTECGAYDQGKVIGKYVSPFFALKVASIVAKGGKLADAVKRVKSMVLTAAEKARLGIKYVPGVRQADGRSWFDEVDIKKRGMGIENALGNNTPDAFPVVDIVNKSTGEVTSIKSKTSTAAYWSAEGGLLRSLKTDLGKLADFVEDGAPARATWERGTPAAGTLFEVLPREVTAKTLLVAVKRGTMTERHYAEVRQAQEYADQMVRSGRSTRPIKIVVVEID
jgi:hypothetical protein